MMLNTNTSVEFSAYGIRSHLVNALVNNDTHAEHFFTYGRLEHVSYFDTIEDLLSAYSEDTLDRSHVCLTTIRLFDRETQTPVGGTHSILLYFDANTGGSLYLYDPNGTYDTKSGYIYLLDRKKLPRRISPKRTMYATGFSTMKIFRNWIEEYTGMIVSTPSTPGIQSVLYTSPVSAYIANYGYCMFYNYFISSFIISQRAEKQNHDTIFKQITGSTRGLRIPTPASYTDAQNGSAPMGTIEQWTADIVNHVFPDTMATRPD